MVQRAQKKTKKTKNYRIREVKDLFWFVSFNLFCLLPVLLQIMRSPNTFKLSTTSFMNFNDRPTELSVNLRVWFDSKTLKLSTTKRSTISTLQIMFPNVNFNTKIRLWNRKISNLNRLSAQHAVNITGIYRTDSFWNSASSATTICVANVCIKKTLCWKSTRYIITSSKR